MRIYYSLTTILLLFFITVFSTLALASAPRVVSLGGPLTEIIYALNAEQHLVAVDQSSVYPAAANQLPKVGYYRQFSLEGVLASKADIVLATDQAGPPQALAQLRKMGIKVIILPGQANLSALSQRIRGVAAALNLPQQGEQMVKQISQDVKALQPATSTSAALMLMSRSGEPEGAGKNTSADAMMQLAGLRNVLAQQQGYKPLSREGMAALRPDVIITTTSTLSSMGGMAALLARPGLAQSPAAKNKRVIVMDDLLLLGFGPRLPEALRQLMSAAK
ncbi:heme/hemin ABC transporter substrate-binding protein [Deefgea piscis]|uniref:heme/hemin ABC transporter substrate-binding protein n=1 Tax=Deefgea piscis TaxID=2739061 RepID=UPI001C8076AB|nr:hemin ABC transporter substrate-binding protein [Deefgea piscis]QZA82074.1 hemin ABC transporter substrate-binding protein [Deefgea piscis]